MRLTIGGVILPTNLLLAPVAGYYDLANRLVVRSIKGVPCQEGHLDDERYDIGDGTYGPWSEVRSIRRSTSTPCCRSS